jgi:sugar phosphate isomerase/epimerase
MGNLTMHTVSRRYFLGALASLAPAARLLEADPLGMPIGCQTYPVRDAIGKDFAGTLRELHAIGYRTIEMCSPMSYERGFGPLAKLPPAELRRTIHGAGMRCQSSHFGFRELRENLDERIAWAKGMGLQQMVLSSFGLRRDATMADWEGAADALNKIGEQVHKAGMEFGYHNHDMEFQKIDGVLIYDRLMSKFDPQMVKMQFQVSVISLGYEAATYLTKYPGRFLSLHLQDWSPAEKKTVAVGKGVVDWPKLFAAAKTGGVKNYFVELNLDEMKESYPYLHALKV